MSYSPGASYVCEYTVFPSGLLRIVSISPSPQSITNVPAAPMVMLYDVVSGVVVMVNGPRTNVSIALFVAIVSAANLVAYSPVP